MEIIRCRPGGCHRRYLSHRVPLLQQAKRSYPSLAKTWVDAGFKHTLVEHGAALGVDVEVVTKDPQVKGFNVVKP